ncbi:thermonuclease family protein [Glaesserella sp.]|uniref:thermonuclease family protein n=1 Tax=Glaesserella sp. TaxID=2094731 RepID=UPI00359F7922
MNKIIHYFAILFLYFSLSKNIVAQSIEQNITCKVVGISDGDSFTCLQQRKPIKIRLQHIDAPELHQAYGNRAKQALATLIFKKTIRLQIDGYDKYQRMLAVAYNEKNQEINLKLVEQGMAWAYHQSRPIYQEAQTQAQKRKIGLWQDKNPINPAEWRAKTSSSNLQKTTPNRPLVSSLNCQTQLTCRQIKDYDSAVKYFRQCGWKELDGNKDGIPCNKLYRKAQQP